MAMIMNALLPLPTVLIISRAARFHFNLGIWVSYDPIRKSRRIRASHSPSLLQFTKSAGHNYACAIPLWGPLVIGAPANRCITRHPELPWGNLLSSVDRGMTIPSDHPHCHATRATVPSVLPLSTNCVADHKQHQKKKLSAH